MLSHLSAVRRREGADDSSEEACPAKAAGASKDAGSDADDSAVEEDTAKAGRKGGRTDKDRERRRKRDAAAAKACELLSGKEEWQEDIDTVQLGNRSFGRFRIAAAAQCPAFGIRRYKATTGRSFFRCSLCDRVSRSKLAASKHSCGRQERAQAAPRQARQRSALAAELLPGGLQLNVHLPAQVCSRRPHAYAALCRQSVPWVASEWARSHGSYCLYRPLLAMGSRLVVRRVASHRAWLGRCVLRAVTAKDIVCALQAMMLDDTTRHRT